MTGFVAGSVTLDIGRYTLRLSGGPSGNGAAGAGGTVTLRVPKVCTLTYYVRARGLPGQSGRDHGGGGGHGGGGSSIVVFGLPVDVDGLGSNVALYCSGGNGSNGSRSPCRVWGFWDVEVHPSCAGGGRGGYGGFNYGDGTNGTGQNGVRGDGKDWPLTSNPEEGGTGSLGTNKSVLPPGTSSPLNNGDPAAYKGDGGYIYLKFESEDI